MDSDSYEIMEGLSLEDFIAYPDENCRVGAPVRYPGEVEESDAENPEDVENIEGEENFGEEDFGEENFGETDFGDGFSEDTQTYPVPAGEGFGGVIDAPASTDPGVAVVDGTEAVG